MTGAVGAFLCRDGGELVVLDAIAAALRSPGGQAVLRRVAEEILKGRGEYRDKHWGREGRGAALVEPPSGRGPLVLLGALSKVAYVTQKGRDHEPVEYRHSFEPRLPLLYFDREGDLVIVRGRSEYDVTTHGIEG